VEEVDTAKGAGHKRVNPVAGALQVDLGIAADMGEDLVDAHLDQSQLCVVAVGEEILEAVEAGTHETEGLVQVLTALAAGVVATQLDALAEEFAEELGRRLDTGPLAGDVALHAEPFVDGQLTALVNGTTEATVVLSRILIVGVWVCQLA
jgi:hypothetical protein